MKKFILLFTIFLLFSCSTTQTIIDPISKKEVKVFENDEFSFNYPKSWVEYGNKPNFLNIQAQLAPKKEIRVINKPQTNLVFKQGETVQNKTRDYGSLNQRVSFNRLTIYRTGIKNINFEDYIKTIKNISKDLKYTHAEYKNTFLKQNNKYYIQIRTIRPSENTNKKIIEMNLTNHFIKHGEYIYKISFMFRVEKEKEYLDDSAYILNSFKFTDGTKLK